MEVRRKLITEKNQVNSSISLDNIYNAIKKLSPKYQVIILENYKIAELYSIFADNEGYRQYLNNLFAVSREYSNRVFALTALHTAAFLESMKKQEETNTVEIMSQVYDSLAEEDKKKFCENMFEKKDFFQDAHTMMMDSFKNAVEIQNNDTVIEQTEK